MKDISLSMLWQKVLLQNSSVILDVSNLALLILVKSKPNLKLSLLCVVLRANRAGYFQVVVCKVDWEAILFMKFVQPVHNIFLDLILRVESLFHAVFDNSHLVWVSILLVTVITFLFKRLGFLSHTRAWCLLHLRGCWTFCKYTWSSTSNNFLFLLDDASVTNFHKGGWVFILSLDVKMRPYLFRLGFVNWFLLFLFKKSCLSGVSWRLVDTLTQLTNSFNLLPLDLVILSLAGATFTLQRLSLH